MGFLVLLWKQDARLLSHITRSQKEDAVGSIYSTIDTDYTSVSFGPFVNGIQDRLP